MGKNCLCFEENRVLKKMLVFGPVRLKGRDTGSRVASLMPTIYTESISCVAGRDIECRAAVLDPRNVILGFLRLFK